MKWHQRTRIQKFNDMKKGLFIIGGAALAVAAYFFIAGNKEKAAVESNTQQFATIAHSDVFNSTGTAMLQDYYTLKNLFVEWDTSAIKPAIASLTASLNGIVADSAAEGYTALAKSKEHMQTLSQANNLENQRKAFNSLSLSLYTFLQETQYTVAKIYKQECPMAFYDTVAAWWLSDNPEVVNPYLGTKHPRYKSGMLHCGELKDSISFAALP